MKKFSLLSILPAAALAVSVAAPVAFAEPGADLTVRTAVINNQGGTAVAGDFMVSVINAAPTPAAFYGSTGGISVSVAPGSYSVTGEMATGYTWSAGAGCSGTISDGQTRSCTITYNDTGATPLGLTSVSGTTSVNGVTSQNAAAGSTVYANPYISGSIYDPLAMLGVQSAGTGGAAESNLYISGNVSNGGVTTFDPLAGQRLPASPAIVVTGNTLGNNVADRQDSQTGYVNGTVNVSGAASGAIGNGVAGTNDTVGGWASLANAVSAYFTGNTASNVTTSGTTTSGTTTSGSVTLAGAVNNNPATFDASGAVITGGSDATGVIPGAFPATGNAPFLSLLVTGAVAVLAGGLKVARF